MPNWPMLATEAWQALNWEADKPDPYCLQGHYIHTAQLITIIPANGAVALEALQKAGIAPTCRLFNLYYNS